MPIYLPSTGPEAWRRLLADPELHWKDGRSAKTLAHRWEDARGLPPEIADLLIQAGGTPELLIALPEHKVPLPGGRRDSQNDILALVRIGENTGAVAIEGKVDESFGPRMSDWLVNAKAGKRERLAYLCGQLGLDPDVLPDGLRYQLLHRASSAIIEAKRFNMDMAVMLVHSFSPSRKWFGDFAAFAALFGIVAEPGRLAVLPMIGRIPVFVGWACGVPANADRTREVGQI